MRKKIPFLIKYFIFQIFCVIAALPLAFADDESICKPFKDFVKDGTGDNFILIVPFRILAKAITNVANLSWNSFASPLQGVVTLGTAIYIAVYTLKNLGSFSKQDLSNYLTKDKTGIIPLCFKLMVIVALLGNSTFIYTYLIGPLISSSFEVGSMLSGFGGLSANMGSAGNVGALFSQVEDIAKSFNDQMYSIVARGRLLFCLATPPDLLGPLGWHWTLIPFALLIYVVGWFILIGTSFHLIDVMIRLGVACIMLPMAVACTISRITNGYAKKNWELIINCCFDFIIIGTLVLLSVELIDVAMGAGELFDEGRTKWYTKDEAEDFADSVGAEFVKILTLTAICAQIILKMFGEVENITKTLSGGGGVGKTASKVGGDFTKKSSAVIKAPAKFAGGVAKSGIKEVGKDIGNSAPARAVRRNYRNFKASVKKAFGLKD